MAEGLYCYQCEQAYPIAIHPPRCNEAGDRVCPQCASDFIELRQDPQPDAQLLRGLRSQLGLPQIEEPVEPASNRPSVQHHSFVTPGGTRVAVSLRTTTFMADQMPTDGSNMIIAALSSAFGGQNPMMINLGNLLGGNDTGLSMADFASGELGLEHILQRLMDQYQPQASPASTSAVAELPRLKVSSSAQAACADAARAESSAACKIGDACTVCHDDFSEGTEVVQLPCKHCFHQDCLLPWLEAHNTCPVCRHALPVETNPRRTTSQRDPEELHHPAVEAALSGIGHGQVHRQHNDPRADPFWHQQRMRQTQDQPQGTADGATGSPAMPPAQQAFHESVRQAMTNAANLGDAAEAAQGMQELANSLRLYDSSQWASQPGQPQMFAFAAGPDGRSISLGQQRNDNPFSSQMPTRHAPQAADGLNDDEESMPALLTDDEESDDYDDDWADEQAHSGLHGEATQPRQAARRSFPPGSAFPAAVNPRQEDLESHPAGSSIDDIDIELPLLQDEYASSEDALEGTSGVDEDMPSLLHDELASSGSEHAGSREDTARATTHAHAGRAAPHQPHGSALDTSDFQPDSAASSMTARTMLDPAQACAMENLPNKRLKREGSPWSDSSQPTAGGSREASPSQDGEPRPESEVNPQQADRPFGGPLTWARRGAGALTSWALGMAGFR